MSSVGMALIMLQEVLRITLHLMETTEGFDAGEDLTCPKTCFFKRRQIGASRFPLPCIRGEKRAAILGSVIGAQMIKRGGIGNNRKENPHQVTIADDLGIISDANHSSETINASDDPLQASWPARRAAPAGNRLSEAPQPYTHTTNTKTHPH